MSLVYLHFQLSLQKDARLSMLMNNFKIKARLMLLYLFHKHALFRVNWLKISTSASMQAKDRHRKSSIKPPGGLLDFGHSRGDLLEGGAYSENQMTRMYKMAFQFFCSIFFRLSIQFYESNT